MLFAFFYSSIQSENADETFAFHGENIEIALVSRR